MMKNLGVLAALAVGFGGCAQPAGEETVVTEDWRPQQVRKEEAGRLRDFAFRLVGAALPEGSTENQLLSPISVQLALSLLLNGTRVESAEVLRETLGIGDMGLEQINTLNQSLVQAMVQDDAVQFEVANSVWSMSGVRPRTEYQNTLRNFYDTEFYTLTGATPAQTNRLNAWVRDNTKGRIERIIDSLNPLDRVILVNALAFDGDWQTQFDKNLTRKATFTPETGAAREVAMMSIFDGLFPYHRAADGSRAVSMPYKGGQFGMLLLLPPKGAQATDYLRTFDAGKLDGILDAMAPTQARVTIPKIRVEKGYALKDALSKMGMGALFVHADLGGIAPELAQGVYISRVEHKTFLKWDEEGTEAAAATGIIGTTRAVVEPPEFIGDRPFAYLLLHMPTRSLIFAGVVHEPEE
jgi:serine protease inhibitor